MFFSKISFYQYYRPPKMLFLWFKTNKIVSFLRHVWPRSPLRIFLCYILKKRSHGQMVTVFEKSSFDDQTEISNSNLSIFLKFVLPVLQTTPNVVFVIKNNSFLHHFWSFSPFIIDFWLYILKKRSYGQMDIIFRSQFLITKMTFDHFFQKIHFTGITEQPKCCFGDPK